MSVEILRENSNHFDWVGIYLVREKDLVLEAYAGHEETEHVRIPIGEGICGAAAKEEATIVGLKVSRDGSFFLSFGTTRSESDVPIMGRKAVLGGIDIDNNR